MKAATWLGYMEREKQLVGKLIARSFPLMSQLWPNALIGVALTETTTRCHSVYSIGYCKEECIGDWE